MYECTYPDCGGGEFKKELDSLKLQLAEVQKERDELKGALIITRTAFNSSLNNILSIPSNGFHFHIRKEGDAFKQLKAHFISKAKEGE